MGVLDIPVPRAADLAATYAPLGASYKALLASSGDPTTAGYSIVPHGVPIVTNTTITAGLISGVYPTIGGTSVWQFVAFHAGGTHTVIGTATVADGGVAAVNNSLSYAAVAGDLILCQNTASNGTQPLTAPAFRLAFGGSITIPTAPAAASTLIATPGPTYVDLSWTGTAAATDYEIRINGVSSFLTSQTTFRHYAATSSTNSYQIWSRLPLNISATGSNTVTSGPASVYTYYTANAAGPLDSTYWATALGTNSGTAIAVDAAGKVVFTSGNVGSNAVQDRVSFQWKPPLGATTTYSAMDWQWHFGMQTSGVVTEHFMRADTLPGSFADPANYAIRIGCNAAGYFIRTCQASLNSGASVLLTISTSTQATVTSASGQINWPIGVTSDTTHTYGVRFRLEQVSGGTQVLNIYHGTTAALDAGTATLINTITLTTTQVSALPSITTCGYYSMILLGQQSATTPISQKYSMDTATMTPLTAAGT